MVRLESIDFQKFLRHFFLFEAMIRVRVCSDDIHEMFIPFAWFWALAFEQR